MTNLIIRSIPTGPLDNYAHVIHDPDAKTTVCVDPGESMPVIQALKSWGWSLTHILVTHAHHDHIGGIDGLVDEFKCEIFADRRECPAIPHCHVGVADRDEIKIKNLAFKVMDIPGHLKHHLAYYLESENALFSGDTLFSLGCGKMFEGTAMEFWHSLKKIRELPPQTLVYGAHEYTVANAKFALSIDPFNIDLINRSREVNEIRAKGLATIPSTLASEIKCNPFLRCDVPAFQDMLGLSGQDGAHVFAQIRRQKDQF